jgi:hypothetical protein
VALETAAALDEQSIVDLLPEQSVVMEEEEQLDLEVIDVSADNDASAAKDDVGAGVEEEEEESIELVEV